MARNGSARTAFGLPAFGLHDLGRVGADAPARRKSRVLIRVGIAMLIAGVLAFVGGFVLMGVNAFDTVRDGIDPERELDLSLGVPGEGTVDLDAGRYQIVALGDTLVSVSGRSSDAGGYTVTRLPFAEPPVTVTGPDGSVIALEAPGHDRLSSAPGLDAVGMSEFTAPADGSYRVTVGGESAAVTKIGVDEADSLWESAEPWIRSSVVTAIGGMLMTVGALVLVGGILRSALGTGMGGLRRLGRGG